MKRIWLTLLALAPVSAIFAVDIWGTGEVPRLTDPANAPQTIEEIWSDYERHYDKHNPLEAKVHKTWERNDGRVVVNWVQLTVGTFQGKKALVCGYWAYPKGAKNLPGIVMFHGGPQTAGEEGAVNWARLGYACFHPNHNDNVEMHGEAKGLPNTDWSAANAWGTKGPYGFAADATTIDAVPSPRNNWQFPRQMSGRRITTFMTRQPQVDPKRIGVRGHSTGGTLTTYVAIDPRVTAVVPSVGGVGGFMDPHPVVTGNVRPGIIRGKEQRKLYDETLESRTYWEHMHAPVLLLGASNDFNAPDWNCLEAMKRATVDKRYISCANYNHRFPPETMAADYLWFQDKLKGEFTFPPTPGAELILDRADGIPVFRVTPPETGLALKRVEMFYTDGRNPLTRFWLTGDPEKNADGTWETACPVMHLDEPLFAFANVIYAIDPIQAPNHRYHGLSEMAATSDYAYAWPDQLQAAGIKAVPAKNRMVDDFSAGLRDWGGDLRNGHWWNIDTRKIADARFLGPKGAELVLEVNSPAPGQILGVVVERQFMEANFREHAFYGFSELPGQGWNTVRIKTSDLRNPYGWPLDDWHKLSRLALMSGPSLKRLVERNYAPAARAVAKRQEGRQTKYVVNVGEVPDKVSGWDESYYKEAGDEYTTFNMVSKDDLLARRRFRNLRWEGGTYVARTKPYEREIYVHPETGALENALTKVAYDLERGVFSVVNKADGAVIIRDAVASANQSAFVGPADRTWKKAAVSDALGEGQSLSVTTPGKELDLIQVFTLYADRAAVVLQSGVRSKSANPVRIKELAVLDNAKVWPDIEPHEEPKTLDGMAGWDHFQETKTRVEDGARRWSHNNLLYTFKQKSKRRSLVFGGLVYRDFAAIAAIDNGIVRLRSEDPVGRRVDAGQVYMPEDRFYLDGSKTDIFDLVETYGRAVASINDVQVKAYTFPTVCAWYAFGYFHGKGGTFYAQNPDAGNNTPTCVKEIDIAKETGFLNYAPVAIRLVPDKYLGDTEQGWWDDAHWQKFGHYKAPYETSEKYCRAVLERGGLPFTYFQTGLPSDDYAKAFPGHMMRNDISELDKLHMHHVPYVTFDYTDKGFQKHLKRVWGNLRKAGLKGVMFDYPETAWRKEGGFEDEYTTCAAAYRKVFEIAREGLGPEAFLHERNLGWPNVSNSDGTKRGTAIGDGVPIPVLDNCIGLVNSQRVMGDTVDFKPEQVRRCGLRWYKCRTLYAYDMDAKAISKDPEQRRAMLTMVYMVSGRLLLGTGFANMTPAMVHDLSRTFPYHTQRKSARPIDLLLRDVPMVYDFDVTGDWHQLCLYNGQSTKEPVTVSVPLSGTRADGALGLDADAEYYLYDFWNNLFPGKLKGTHTLQQKLRGGEARMLSIHRAQEVPQFLSTSRHVMQGYLDLVKKPAWKKEARVLEGVSAVVANDPYELVFACNGRNPIETRAFTGEAVLGWKDKENGIGVLTLKTAENADVQWSIRF